MLGIGAYKQRMPREEDMLPGRSTPLPLHNVHFVNGHPLQGAFEGLQQVEFGLGCFWGAERKFWNVPGVYSTSVGYAGGGTRNIFSNRPARNMAELRGLPRARPGPAPIWSRTFQAIGMAPQVIAYNEVYNAIQNNVIEAGENEAAGVEQMRFYEVGRTC